MSIDARRGDFEISTDANRMDVAAIHRFLTRSYWAEGIQESTIRRSIANSLCFGLFRTGRQIGYARVVTDRATFAYLADVFVVEEYRREGLAKWMLEVIIGHPDLQGLRRWMLSTRDAHELYRKHGFRELASPSRFMEMYNDDVYRGQPSAVGDDNDGSGGAER